MPDLDFYDAWLRLYNFSKLMKSRCSELPWHIAKAYIFRIEGPLLWYNHILWEYGLLYATVRLPLDRPKLRDEPKVNQINLLRPSFERALGKPRKGGTGGPHRILSMISRGQMSKRGKRMHRGRSRRTKRGMLEINRAGKKACRRIKEKNPSEGRFSMPAILYESIKQHHYPPRPRPGTNLSRREKKMGRNECDGGQSLLFSSIFKTSEAQSTTCFRPILVKFSRDSAPTSCTPYKYSIVTTS